MYKKEFEIRWSDVDANAHLANSAYTNFMSHTRMGFFTDYGFSMQEMHEQEIGPVVFYEHMYYFKEAYLGTPITVTLELIGLSKDGMFFKFEHNFYNDKGENLANCEIFGAWIDTEKRSLTALPEALLTISETFPKAINFRTLTKEDTRKHGKRPVNLG
ncbi:thioesterase [Flavobacteriales bacterium 34_180_T64]|nr:thioesterase [Flavobacteriales bacterium 34_180_T64]